MKTVLRISMITLLLITSLSCSGDDEEVEISQESFLSSSWTGTFEGMGSAGETVGVVNFTIDESGNIIGEMAFNPGSTLTKLFIESTINNEGTIDGKVDIVVCGDASSRFDGTVEASNVTANGDWFFQDELSILGNGTWEASRN